ncbi:MAG: hypothetical protein WBY53_03055 [Acidobacteriaceae bacterium]
MSEDTLRTNGAGAASLVAAGIGATALGVLAVAGDKSAMVKGWMMFYRPTGPLSGVTTTAILIWLVSWAVLEWRWGKREVAMGRVCWVAIGLLVVGVLLTFPPVGDLF